MELRNVAVVVTGASRGLGAALVKELASRGAKVVGVARAGEALGRVIDEARAAGGEAHAVVADVADKEATYRIAGSAAALVGAVDVVIHNASTLGPVPLRGLGDTECEDVEKALAVNVVGPFRLTKALVGSMAVRGRGVVLHVTSDAAVSAYATWGAYGASKAAFDHVMRVWAEEVRGLGVRFVSVDPGEMDTKMHSDAMPDADRAALARPADVARRMANLLARVEEVESGGRVEAATFEGASTGEEVAA